jgi:hypothetical protein
VKDFAAGNSEKARQDSLGELFSDPGWMDGGGKKRKMS